MFRIRQKVVCVDVDGPGEWRPEEALIKGGVYTIHSLFSDSKGPLVRLCEVKRHPDCIRVWGHDGYGAFRFRPLVERKTDISIFQAMLTPSPVTVDAMKLADHAREIVG